MSEPKPRGFRLLHPIPQFLVKIKGPSGRWHSLICSNETLQRMKKAGPRGLGGELVDTEFTVKPL